MQGQRKHPRSPATTAFFLGRKLLPGSLSKGQGRPVGLHSGGGFAERSGSDKSLRLPWGCLLELQC